MISDAPVRHYETTKAEAERIGAIAFFGEKYGEIVRVLEAGPSTELCGGTHVHALGFIGPIKIVSESSIGSNLRRIEAVTGDGAFEYVEQEEDLLRRAGTLLRAAPKEIPEKIERLSEQVRTLQEELQRLKAKEAVSAAADLARRRTTARSSPATTGCPTRSCAGSRRKRRACSGRASSRSPGPDPTA